MQPQQAFNFSIFCGRIHGDVACFAPCQHRDPRLRVTRTHIDNLLLKVFWRANHNASSLQKCTVDTALLGVACLIFGRERNGNMFLMILCKIVAFSKFSRRTPVNLWSNQYIQISMCHIVTFRCGTQAQTKWRKRAFRNQTIGRCGQMMTLVKNEQAKGTQFTRIERGRIIRNNRDWLNLFFAATKDTNLINW